MDTQTTQPETLEQYNERIKKMNAEFEAMTPEQKRVAIAKDVLASIAAKRFNVTTGHWVDFGRAVGNHNDWAIRAPAGQQLHEVFYREKLTEKCDVCALGSLFLCAVERADKLTVAKAAGYDWGDLDEQVSLGHKLRCTLVFDYLEQWFSMDQLRLMEIGFEMGRGQFRTSDEVEEKVAAFYLMVRQPSERLRGIMENVVRNNGEFNPHDLQPASQLPQPEAVL